MKRTFHIFAAPLFLLGAVLGTLVAAQNSPSKPATRRAVAITFDDLPAPADSVVSDDAVTLKETNRKLLEVLHANHVPAIGFVNEQRLYTRGEIDARVAILQMWLDAGLELGNHTFSHMDLETAALAAYQEDVIRGATVTTMLLQDKGRKLRYFRHPFLHVGPNLAIRRDFERFLTRRGYTVAPVTLNNEGYMFGAAYARARARGDNETAERVAKAYLAYMEQIFDYFEKLSVAVLGYEVKQVLLVHDDTLNADYFDALAGMIEKRGYAFITLDQALQDKAYRLPDTYSGERGLSWIHHWAFTRGKKTRRGPEVPEFVRKQSEGSSH